MDDGGHEQTTTQVTRLGGRTADEWLRLASTAVIVIGLVGAVSWLWMVLRSQGLIGENVFGFDDVSLTERIDAIAQSLDRLVVAAIGFAIGVALRRQVEQPSA